MSWILELIVIFHALLYREIISFQIMDSSDEENNVKRANSNRVSLIKILDSSDESIKDKGEKRENPITIMSNSDDEREVVVSREEEINENDDEDDLLILNVNEADVEGMSIGEEEERDEEIEQSNPIDSEPAAANHSDRKAKKKKHRKIKGSKSKKAKKDKDKGNNLKLKENGIEEECQESGGLSPRFSSEDEEEKVHVEIKAKRRKLNGKKQKEKQKVAVDFDCELSEDRTILTEGTVNSLGNYCPRMLAGLICQEKDCSWTHFMMPADAAGQFKKIINFR